MDELIPQLVADGPVTLELVFRRLREVAPDLAARGMPWLFAELRRSPHVQVLPGSRFEYVDGANQLEVEFEPPDDRPSDATPEQEPESQSDPAPPAESEPEEVADARALPLATDSTFEAPPVRPGGGSYVVFDLEANNDRTLVEEHEIIEIGACRIRDGVVVEEFSTLVQPGRPLTRFVSQLTGLTDSELADAPQPGDALRNLVEFVDGWPLVAHNGFGYDFKLLDAALIRANLPVFNGLRLDTLELAHIVFPRSGDSMLDNSDGTKALASRSLDGLSEYFGRGEARADHRALGDAQLTATVLSDMLETLSENTPTRNLQRWLLAAGSYPWADWLEAPESPPPLEQVVPPAHFEPSTMTSSTFDVRAAVAPLELGGQLVSRPGRRHRPQQADMAQRVAGALHAGGRKMIEAPTGTGKTLAYLVPAIAWARAAGEPVVVATHSKVLQNQIVASLDELSSELGHVKWVILKGSNNYVSLDSLAGAIEAVADDPLEALTLAVVAGWVATTPTGDWDDLRAWALEERVPDFAATLWRLSLEGDSGIPQNDLDELCFHRRALEGLSEADIAVVNHAVLISRSDVTTEIDHLVVDEAHNLEESATGALAEAVGTDEVLRLLRTIHDPTRRWGTLGRYADATGVSKTDERIADAVVALVECESAIKRLAPLVIDYVRLRTPVHVDEVEKYGASYRIRQGADTDRAAYQPVSQSFGDVCTSLISLAEALDKLDVPDSLRKRYRRRRLEAEISRMGRTARNYAAALRAVSSGVDDELWVNLIVLGREQDRWTWQARRVPIDVSDQLSDIWESMRSVVLTSATLTVAGSMTHLIERLGLGSVEPTRLESPFDDLAEQSLLVLPNHLPTPRGGLMDEFTIAEADEIARLFSLSKGRALGLFTSRARMEHVRDHARPLLEMQQLPLLCQGDEPSPALIERMRSEISTSLLATRSFWEGIDVPGEALSLLAIEKLPFGSPGDPIVSARMDHLERQGRDPFADYLVPEAVLRFVQGVGRLIRNETDVGACVVLDKRLRRPTSYREQFLDSLPGPPRIVRPDSARSAYMDIASHLGSDADLDEIERLFALPSGDRWSDIEQLELSDDDIANDELVDQRFELIRERLGFSDWRPGQLEIMRAFTKGEDVLAILPTGTGKSLTYQLPALIRPGLTIVVSPLVALMRDQVESLRERGLTRVAAIFSGQAQSEQEEILSRAAAGAYKLLYVSPERLWSQRFRAGLQDVHVGRIAVDEAHCIAQWGHTFRPEYAQIPAAIAAIAQGTRPAVLAATATATPEVQSEIVSSLRLELTTTHTAHPDRPELHYYVEPCGTLDDRRLKALQVVDAFRGQSAIVYVPKQAMAQEIAELLRADNHIARAYHGGTEAAERTYVEEAFRFGEIDVVVATKAFGLGIDKPDIALVLHIEMPGSVEEYVQETGRAARGAAIGVGPRTGTCVLLTAPRDCSIHRMFISTAAPSIEHVKGAWRVLKDGDRFLTIRDLAGRIGDDVKTDEAELAVHYLVSQGAVVRGEDATWQGRIVVPRNAMSHYDGLLGDGLSFPAHTRAVLKHCADRGSSDFHLITWSDRLDLAPDVLERCLLELHRRDVLSFSGWEMALHLTGVAGAEPDFKAIAGQAEQRRSAVRRLSAAAKSYASQQSQCRRRYLMSYLGAPTEATCGACDICQTDLPREWRSSQAALAEIAGSTAANLRVRELVSDVSGRQFSRRNLELCLAGSESEYGLPSGLQDHPLNGALRHLGERSVSKLVDQEVAAGWLREVVVESGDRTWISLRTADQ